MPLCSVIFWWCVILHILYLKSRVSHRKPFGLAWTKFFSFSPIGYTLQLYCYLYSSQWNIMCSMGTHLLSQSSLFFHWVRGRPHDLNSFIESTITQIHDCGLIWKLVLFFNSVIFIGKTHIVSPQHFVFIRLMPICI